MLKTLSLTNFKAWKRVPKMRLAPLTGLFGTNSSGKSSILQFLLMLKQTADATDRRLVLHLGDEKSLVSLGTLSDVIHGHTVDSAITMHLEWDIAKPLIIKDPDKQKEPLFSANQMAFEAELHGNAGGKLEARSLAYTLGDAKFTLSRKDSLGKYKLASSAPGFKFKRQHGRKWPLPPPVKFYGFADEVRSYHQNAGFLSDLELEFEKLLRGVYYLGPLREYPRREYPWSGGHPTDMGRRGENAVPAILASRDRGEMISRGKGKPKLSLEGYVAHWLKQLGLISEFRVEEISKGTNLFQVHVRKTPGASEVLITDVGFGISQVLPVLVLCYYALPGSTILLEQPEIHLHPSVQSGLADVFIDAINVRGVQIIVESHSEHFLRRLQRRIAEGDQITQDRTSLYFCAATDDGAGLNVLDLDVFGNIKNWPKDFFGNEMEDIAAMSEASMKRRGVGKE